MHKSETQTEAVAAVTENRAMLDLDAPRAVSFKTKRGVFVYHFRRILQADWERFFMAIVHQTVHAGTQREEVFESESALIDLVERTLTGVDGYGDLSAIKDWKRALPLQHRLTAGIGLRGVGPAPARGDEPILCDLVEIAVDANWGTGPAGKMKFFSGLLHRFRQPRIEDLKRFNFEAARVRVTGTAESGTTTYPARQAIAMKLYDDLIESVDGYAAAGQPLTGVEAIRREMDGAHKAAAALALIAGSDEFSI